MRTWKAIGHKYKKRYYYGKCGRELQKTTLHADMLHEGGQEYKHMYWSVSLLSSTAL
ncbi:hypothetical protein BN1221_04161c [Brenneria goodwinii]|uniref:Uncharacterized protein n=1 Tax=Brenneria goodwinii TaxID=1109412 RepID=A0A0G4K172_9GAMM|nr:hypothetical protein BN1221_04161c [Brenneria goodwinii]